MEATQPNHMNLLQRHQPDLSWFSELDRFFNPGRSLAAHASNPETIHETPDSWVLRLDVPGFTKDDVKLKAEDQQLVLEAETAADRPFSRKIDRRWKLGSRIDASNIGAKLENGVLEITLPKTNAPEARSIEIQ